MRKKQLPLYIFLGIAVVVLLLVVVGIYSQKTTPLTITFYPQDGYATPWLQFSIQFSEPVNHQAAEAAISIDPFVSGEFFWNENVVTFKSQNPLRYGELFNISITEFTDAENKLSLSKTETNQAKIREANIMYTSILDGSIYISDLYQNTFQLPSDTVILELIPSYDGRYFVSLTQITPTDTQVIVQFSQDHSIFSIYQCPEQSICSNLVVSPNSLHFLVLDYSRVTNQTSVILVDIEAASSTPILTVPGILLDKPVWSNQGDQFALFSPSENKVIVTNIDNSEQAVYEKEEVTLGAWSPDDSKIYNRHTHRDVTSTYSHLCVLDLQTGEFSPIENEGLPNGQYSAPLLIPGTTLLLFSKQAITGENTSQLWLYDFANNTVSQITDNPSYAHGNFHADVSGTFIVYQRIDVTKSDSTPEIWMWNLETNESTLIASAAVNPQWLQ